MTVPVSDMASYDAYDANHNGFTGYELDAGDYIFTVRHDAHDVDDDAAANQLPVTCLPTSSMPRTPSPATRFPTSSPAAMPLTVSAWTAATPNQNITYMTRADFAGTSPRPTPPAAL